MKKSDFNKLKDKWYAKLERTGFHDIELKSGHLENNSTSGGTIDPRRVTWESQAEYYQMATDFLNDWQFEDRIERIIWEYRANGLSPRSIAKTLNKVRRKKINYITVWRMIKRLETEMKKLYGVTK